MGLLNIRTRTENLGNIGAVRQVATETGAADAFITAGRAQARTLNALGKFAGDVGDVADEGFNALMDMKDEQEQAEVDDAANKFRVALDQHNYTDGTSSQAFRDHQGAVSDGEASGAMDYSRIADPALWYDANTQAVVNIDNSLTADMTSRQREEYMRKTRGVRLSANEMWQKTALKLRSERAEQRRTAAIDTARRDILADLAQNGDSEPTERQAELWSRYETAVNEQIAAHPELQSFEATAKMKHDLAYGFVSDAAKQYIANVSASANAAETSQEADKMFTDAITAAKKGALDFLPIGSDIPLAKPNGKPVTDKDGKPMTRNVIREWLGDDTDLKSLNAAVAKDMEAEYNRHMGKRARAEAERERAVKATITKEESAIFKSTPTPEGATDQQRDAVRRERAEQYAALAQKAEDAGIHDEALRLRKVADTLHAASKTRAKKTSITANDNGNLRYLQLANDIDQGAEWSDEQGEFIEMTEERAMFLATEALVAGEITDEQFERLQAKTVPLTEEKYKRVKELMLHDIESIIPDAIEFRKGLYRVSPTKAGKTRINELSPTGLEAGSEEQEVTYGHLVKAMNAAINFAKRTNATDEQTRDHFQMLIKGEVDGIQRRNVEEAIEMDREIGRSYTNLMHNSTPPSEDKWTW